MTNWFQTDSAYQLFLDSNGEIQPLKFKTPNCACVVAIHGKAWSKRAIIQGGIDINSKATQDEVQCLLQSIITHCSAKWVVYIEVRNFSDYSSYKECFERQAFQYHQHFDVHIPLSDYKFPEPKRRQILKLQNEGQYWEPTRKSEDVGNWYKLLSKLYSRKIHRPLPSEHFFQLAVQHPDCHLLIVRNSQKQIIGGVFMPVFDSISYEWYICGNMLSTVAAIEWSKQNHIVLFDAMGAGIPSKPYGVRDFKLQMGGTLHEFGRFVYINRPIIYSLGNFLINRFI